MSAVSEYLTPDEAAAVLKCGRSLVYGLVSDGELRGVRLGTGPPYPHSLRRPYRVRSRERRFSLRAAIERGRRQPRAFSVCEDELEQARADGLRAYSKPRSVQTQKRSPPSGRKRPPVASEPP